MNSCYKKFCQEKNNCYDFIIVGAGAAGILVCLFIWSQKKQRMC